MKEIICYLIAIIIFVFGIGFIVSMDYQNEQTITCTVKDKWVKNYKNDSTYLVLCDDEVYKISDLFYKGKFNSSNIYSKLEKNHRYKITVTGYRVPILSWYQNINEVEEK